MCTRLLFIIRCMNPKGNIKHGGHGTLTYMRWKSMMQRCNDPKAVNYKYYGAVGIKVCDRWHDFQAFLADMGKCADKSLTLDRIDNAKGYKPGNCRWVTRAAQNKHRPSHRVELTHNGETHSVTEWAAIIGISANTINQRLYVGWSAEKALTTPLQSSGRFGNR